MMQNEISIFRRYFEDEPFIDRFLDDPDRAVDVIVPVMHTNELWRTNLRSFYREVPVNRLLVGDGGCVDDSTSIAREFPRVEVFDHRSFTSLGYSIRKLIEEVRTEWFVYFHSDVYLPPGWFEDMLPHRERYDWFECRQQATLLVEYPLDRTNVDRPFSGGQMGRKAAFETVLPVIEDDYLYRNEDIIIAALVEQAGHRYGRADDAFHYHQTMYKPSPWGRRVKSVGIEVETSPEEELRTWAMQARGIVKYLEPTPSLVGEVRNSLIAWDATGEMDWGDFKRWVGRTNPAWLPFVSRRWLLGRRFRDLLRAAYHSAFG